MSKKLGFVKSRETPAEPNIAGKKFIEAIDNHSLIDEEGSQPGKKWGKVTSVVLDDESTMILEKLSKIEDI